MNCDRSVELILDSLVQPLEDAQSRELERHVSTCASCAETLKEHERLWKAIPYVSNELPTDTSGERLMTAVHREFGQPVEPVRTSTAWYRLAAVVAAFAVMTLIGFGLFQSLDRDDTEATESDDRVRFLVIMTEIQVAPERQAEADEAIADWFRSLQEQGIMEEHSGTGLGSLVGAPPDGPLLAESAAGIIIIRATDGAAARRIIGSSPIIDYGGFIEIREVE